MPTINIGNIMLVPIEYQCQLVVTFKIIDQIHERLEGTARKRFYINRSHFKDNKDYFHLTYQQIKSLELAPNSRGLIVLTKSGYLKIVRSFRASKERTKLMRCEYFCEELE